MHQTLTDHEQATITTAARALSDMLHDQAHEASNTTRMLNLYRGYHGDLGEFMAASRRAWSIVVPKLPGLRRPAAYFFRVLEAELAPPVGMSAKQAQAVAYGA